jgi:5-methylcytosine-specific restriction protein A
MPANEVDHIVPKANGGTDDPDNLRAVSHECHKRLTAEQQGKTYRAKVSIGIDGWPK